MTDEGGYWHFSVRKSDGRRVVGTRTSHALARQAVEREREPGDTATLKLDYPGRDEVEFDVDRPTLLDALALRQFRPPHYAGQNIADMLGVELSRLHASLKPLEEMGWLEISDRNEVHETWHLVPPLTSFEDLVQKAERVSFSLETTL